MVSTDAAKVHSSVAAVDGGVSPPTAKANELVTAPCTALLLVLKFSTSVQELPSHDSTSACVSPSSLAPPKAKAAVPVAPAPPILTLIVFKSATSDQLVPLYCSAVAKA